MREKGKGKEKDEIWKRKAWKIWKCKKKEKRIKEKIKQEVKEKTKEKVKENDKTPKEEA